MSLSEPEKTFILVTMIPASFIPYSLQVPNPIFPSSNLSFPLPCQCSQSPLSRIYLPSPLPSLPVCTSLFSQFGSRPPSARACYSFCHSLCSLLSPQPLATMSVSSCALLACSWTEAIHGGQSCCSWFIWQDLLNGTAVLIWYCRKKPCSA